MTVSFSTRPDGSKCELKCWIEISCIAAWGLDSMDGISKIAAIPDAAATYMNRSLLPGPPLERGPSLFGCEWLFSFAPDSFFAEAPSWPLKRGANRSKALGGRRGSEHKLLNRGCNARLSSTPRTTPGNLRRIIS
mmetsp:Transcript_49748/g.82565  ORF Transcript_49748/g.82565 Transcript_49748/m.82565 type:complete len:135 (-) Transcript_49748:56-460(-)